MLQEMKSGRYTYKLCEKCRKIKITRAFEKDSTSPDGYARMCRACERDAYIKHRGTKKCAACGEMKPLSEFEHYLSKPSGSMYGSYCKCCKNEMNIQYKRYRKRMLGGADA